MAAIPHGADSDDSYEVVAGMTDADGNTYYRAKQPTPPIATQGQGRGTAPDTSPNVAITRDQDRRLHTSDGTKV